MNQTKVFIGSALSVICFMNFAGAAFGQAMSADQISVATFKGVEALKQGRSAIAITEFSKLIRAEPTRAEYRALRGSAYLSSDNYPSAAADFETAIKLGDSRPLTKNSWNTAVAGSLACPVSTEGKTVKDLSDLFQAAARRKDFKAALGYANVLAGQSKPGVHQVGLNCRAIAFLMMGRKANARIDAEALIREGADNETVRELLKTASEETPSPAAFKPAAQTTSKPLSHKIPNPKNPKEMKEFLRRF